MRARSVVSLILLAVYSTLGCGGEEAQDSGGTNCQKYCAVAKTLNCANEDQEQCIATCQQRYETAVETKPACKPEFDVAAACFASRVKSDFECSASGHAQHKAQVCALEQGKADTCFRT